MFVIAAWMGVAAIVFVLIEWIRLAFEAKRVRPPVVASPS